MKNLIEKFIPKFFLSFYHFLLAFLAALFYGFPSKKMIVIGVTGTKGKTTVCNLIWQILNYAGFKAGMTSTLNFKIGDKEWQNLSGQTMLGRFGLQRLLKKMKNESCQYAIIETTSEGILQHRQRFIDYDIAIFTNLAPEHIERHGSFEKYKKAKAKLFRSLTKNRKKFAKIRDQIRENWRKIIIVNLDDKNADYFLKFAANEKWGYKIKNQKSKIKNENIKIIEAENCQISPQGLKFFIKDTEFNLKLLGDFNIYNALAAICLGLSQRIKLEKIKEALESFEGLAGRMEIVNEGQDFFIIIDFSHEPTSLENALKSVKIFNPQRIILLFGSAGGGRDKWKRPVMGEIASKYADLIIVTTDDPYDEEPKEIIDDILKGILKDKKRILGKNVFSIVDRKEAIKKAINLAKKGDLILFSGKGGEKWMNVKGGKKIPWNEKEIIKEELWKLKY
jgi:UDP-N-acetylmuramoyl-L-alanyl-D-glutamate--2,6-diaminopimelate ligase